MAEDKDGFDDWVDNLYGFMHLINHPVPAPHSNILLGALIEDIQGVDFDSSEPEEEKPNYNIIPRTMNAARADKHLEQVHDWLTFTEQPEDMSDKEYSDLMQYATGFFIDDHNLWRCDPQGAHKHILYKNRRMDALAAAHDDVGHRGFYATHALLAERYWWPYIGHDVAWYVRTCHICQTRQTRQIAIPPVVATLAMLFAKMYMDTMHLPHSNGFNYIVQGHCSLMHYPEFRMLRKENTQALGEWIFQDVLCRWGTLVEIVSDNGKPFVAALGYLEQKYHVKHIQISGYNSRANGIVERSHFDIQQALFKAADRDQGCWSQAAHSVFWSEHVTPRRRMGCAPYYAVTGTHPLLPFDIIEANYLLPPPDSLLASTDLIARRAVALQKHAEDLNRL